MLIILISVNIFHIRTISKFEISSKANNNTNSYKMQKETKYIAIRIPLKKCFVKNEKIK